MKAFKAVLLSALLITLVLGIGATAQADNRVAPAVNTGASWPFTQGSSGTAEVSVLGVKNGADDYDFVGQGVPSSLSLPAYHSLVPSTGSITQQTYTGGTTANIEILGATTVSSANWTWVGRKVVSAGTETRGVIFTHVSNATVYNNHSFGEASALEEYYAVIELTGGGNAGDIIVAGLSTGSGATLGGQDIVIRRSTAPTISSQAVGFVGTANDDAAYALAEGGNTVYVGGSSGDGSGGTDFFLEKVDEDGAEAGAFSLSGITSNGDSDVIKDILIDASGDLIVVGTTGDAGTTTGFVAKIDSTSGALVSGFEFTTTATGIELNDASLMSDGDILVTGLSGDDIYLAEIQDNGSAFVMDWSNTYDSGNTGDVGNFVEEQGDGTILLAGTTDDAGASTDALFYLFNQPGLAPEVATYNSPADGATGQDIAGVTLDWADGGTGGGQDATTNFDVYFEAGTNPPTVKVVDNDPVTTTTYATGALTGSTTYYWQVVSRDADGDTAAAAVQSFTTISASSYIEMDVATTGLTPNYVDNNNKAGFDADAADTYDAYDVAEPPPPGGSYVSAYFYESGFTGFQQNLTENWYDLDGKDLDGTTYQFPIVVKTDQDATIEMTFDASTGNSSGYGAVLYDGAYDGPDTGTDAEGRYVNLTENSGVVSYTADASGGGGVDTDNFVLLFGCTTAPTVNATLPANGDLGVPLFYRGSDNTITLAFDELNPIRDVVVEFLADTASTSGQTWTAQLGTGTTPITYLTLDNFGGTSETTVDDPTADAGGDASPIDNPDMTFVWNPVADASGEVGATDLFPDARLRFITEDWAGNIDTTTAEIEIGPDIFSYTGDYGAGWHLISLPLKPDPSDDHPDSVFTTATGDNNGIAGDFSVFDYTVASGYTLESDMVISKGYWLVLDNANTAAQTNAGLGDVFGTVTLAGEDVVYDLDPDAWNYIGVPVRNDEITGDGLNPEELEFSDDGVTYVSYDVAVNTNSWISGGSIKPWDNSTGDYGTAVDVDATGVADGVMSPGVGYTIQAGASAPATFTMRINRNLANTDGVDPGGSGDTGSKQGRSIASIEDGEWSVPITVTRGDYSNTLSAFGTHPDASDGFDNGLDFTAPPLPPTGEYVRAYVDGEAWNSGFGRWFTTDIRSPLSEGDVATWVFSLFASESGTVELSFDLSVFDNYEIPAGLAATAEIAGESYDLLTTQSFSFEHDGSPAQLEITVDLSALSAGEVEAGLPTEYAIESAYPNPFNPSTTVRVALPEAGNLRMAVYNVMGQQVTELTSGRIEAGYHSFLFDASGMASGIYFVRATVPGKLNEMRKVVLIR